MQKSLDLLLHPYPFARARRSYAIKRSSVRGEEGRLEGSALRAFVESFATDALGLNLGELISDTRRLPHLLEGVRDRESTEEGSVGWAWQTNRGAFVARVRYDEARSALVKAHVFYFDWKIGGEHHGGWYHAYPKFPRDWVKGLGRENRW
jgi:hypothetical protein